MIVNPNQEICWNKGVTSARRHLAISAAAPRCQWEGTWLPTRCRRAGSKTAPRKLVRSCEFPFVRSSYIYKRGRTNAQERTGRWFSFVVGAALYIGGSNNKQKPYLSFFFLLFLGIINISLSLQRLCLRRAWKGGAGRGQRHNGKASSMLCLLVSWNLGNFGFTQ